MLQFLCKLFVKCASSQQPKKALVFQYTFIMFHDFNTVDVDMKTKRLTRIEANFPIIQHAGISNI